MAKNGGKNRGQGQNGERTVGYGQNGLYTENNFPDLFSRWNNVQPNKKDIGDDFADSMVLNLD